MHFITLFEVFCSKHIAFLQTVASVQMVYSVSEIDVIYFLKKYWSVSEVFGNVRFFVYGLNVV